EAAVAATPMKPRLLSARHRDALLFAILPAPGGGLPALAEVDLTGFSPRFEESAPSHRKLGLAAASLAADVALPLSLGYGRPLSGLGEVAREEVIARASRVPMLAALIDVAKVVACMAYFDDPEVQATARRRS